MPLSKITTNVGSAGIGRRALNRDKVSGLMFFIVNGNLPTGFLTTAREKKVYSLIEAEALGIAKGSANHAVHWYHISEYFRMNPEGELWIGYYAIPGGWTYTTELTQFVLNTNGECRQIGIYSADQVRAYANSELTAIQAVIDGLDAAYQNFHVLTAPDFAAVVAVTGWSSIADNRALTARKVTAVISESGSGDGLTLATAKAYSITSLGNALGCLSKANVSASIGNPANFPLSNGTEMETPALANGDLVSAITSTVLGALKDKGYLVARKYLPDLAGTYYERCPGSIVSTSAYAFVENTRVVNKAIRNVRVAYTPYLNSTIKLKSDGTLSDDVIGFFADIGQAPCDQMVAEGDCSAARVTVNPDQNVLTTSKLTVTLTLVPNGIAEEIVVNINLATSL